MMCGCDGVSIKSIVSGPRSRGRKEFGYCVAFVVGRYTLLAEAIDFMRIIWQANRQLILYCKYHVCERNMYIAGLVNSSAPQGESSKN